MPRRVVLLVHALIVAVLPACDRRAADELPVTATLEVGDLLGGADTLHARAVAVPDLQFPRDHGPHPEFRTEWWYFTGNLAGDDGREFGYQLTFFRSALADSASWLARMGDADAEARSPWRSRHAWMAHFAVSDIASATFHHGEQFARDAAGLAGAQTAPFRVWLNDWQAVDDASRPGAGAAGGFRSRLVAATGDVAIDLWVEQGKPMVLQGERGLSQKGPEPGNASIYYSFTRMPTQGTVRIGDAEYRVTGNSWLDREWSTSALSPDLEGWDWMSLQFNDSTELMLYHLRREDGTAGEFSAGTFVDRDGTAVRLRVDDFGMTPTAHWRSPETGSSWPISWRVEAPSLQLTLDVSAAFGAQEMNVAVRYWEGSVRITGSRGDTPVNGRGYLEMTGY